jgi:hypothetical protein
LGRILLRVAPKPGKSGDRSSGSAIRSVIFYLRTGGRVAAKYFSPGKEQ